MSLSNSMDDDLRTPIVLKLIETSHEMCSKCQFILTDGDCEMTLFKGHLYESKK